MPKHDEIDIDEAAEEEAYVEYDIATYPSDYTIEGLHQMRERGDIIIPDFQRKYVWTIKQASLLVESFLLGLPVPPLFLYINEENKSEVIDGQQRLTSMMYFLEGRFGDPDEKGRQQLFKLTDLSEKSQFRNKTFDKLEEKYQRKLRSSVLRAINIRQLSPDKNNTSVFHIFERLNTGGTSLKPQEIRNAVFRGNVVSVLKRLNSDKNWRLILGAKNPDKYQRDVELVLRLFSLFRTWAHYEKPMKEHLNKAMRNNKEFESENANRFCEIFPKITKIVVEIIGSRPFRPKNVINTAVLEAVMVIMLENHDEIDVGNLLKNYENLNEDSDFIKSVRGSTTDTKIVLLRLERAKVILLG